MTDNQNGEKILSTESKKDLFNEKLDRLLENLIIPKPKITNNIEELLSLTYEQLMSIEQNECYTFSYQLKQYAYYIQQKYNRYKNIEHWARECLRIIYGRDSRNYGNNYTKFEEKQDMIIFENPCGAKLHAIAIEYHCYAEEMNSLSARILDMAKTLDNIGYNRGKND